jgi:primosomal protein N' (replication factor Y)
MLDLVRVAVPVPLRRHFDYLSPLPLPAPGCRVEIPFGPQTLVGLVVGLVLVFLVERLPFRRSKRESVAHEG